MSRGAKFVRFYPSDWRSGCIGLSFEQEGLYVRICAYIYETRNRIPASDSAAARILGANTNAYVKVKKQLCDRGLLTMRDGEWTVSRAEVELAKVDAARTEAEVERRADPRPEWKASQDAIVASTAVTPLHTPPAQAEKTQSFLRATKEPITNNQTDKTVLSCASPELKAAFNGSTENMLTDIGQWMRAERKYAEKWLQSLVSQHGSAKVLDGYAATVRAQAEGRMVADPIRYMSRIAAVSKATTEPAAKPLVPAHVVRYAKPKLEPQPWETN